MKNYLSKFTLKTGMQKRGQVYILGVLILAVVLYGLAVTVNEVRQESIEGDFEKLSENYENEATKFINSIFNSGGDMGQAFSNFTLLFTAYSKSQNPTFELIYALDYNNTIQVGNYMSNPILVDNKSSEGEPYITLDGCFENISATITFEGLSMDVPGSQISSLQTCMVEIPSVDKIWIGIRNDWYPFMITKGQPKIMVISRMAKAEQTRVFVKGEGFVKENITKPSADDFCEKFSRQEVCENYPDYCGVWCDVCEGEEMFDSSWLFRKVACKCKKEKCKAKKRFGGDDD